MFCRLSDSTIKTECKYLPNYTHSTPITFRDSMMLVFRRATPIQASALSQI